MEQDRLVSTTEAARILGLHRSTINRLVHNDRLPVARRTPGGHLRFREADVRRLLTEIEEMWG